MLKPTEGSIRVDGFDPLRDQGAVRRTFGIVFQDPSLDEALTAFENMELHAVLYRVDPRERRERIEKLLRFVELWDRRADKNPDPFIVRATGAVSGVIGLRLWTIVPKSRRWKLSAVSGAGGHRYGSTIPRSIFWRRDHLGSAVWFLKGNLGCARLTFPDRPW